MEFAVRILLLISLSFLSGCYFRATITNPEVASTLNTSLSENHGYVANAKTSSSTVRGYKKSSSIGYFQGETLKNSKTKSYKLYSTIEGQIISLDK